MRPPERDIHLTLQDLAPKAIDLSNNGYIRGEEVKVGNRFTEVNSDTGMFQVVNSLKKYLVGRTSSKEIEQYGPISEYRFDRVLTVIRQMAERKKFYGKLDGCETIILPSDFLNLPKKDSRQEIEVDDAVSFLTVVGMNSTGRGRIGSLMSVSTVYRAHGFPGRVHVIGMVTKPLIVRKDIDAMEQLLTDARENPKKAYQYGNV